MKIRIKEKIYLIEGDDESGLIPPEAKRVLVKYNIEGQPTSVLFALEEPKEIVSEPFDTYAERLEGYYKERKELYNKLNPTRTPDQVIAIANALEKALE